MLTSFIDDLISYAADDFAEAEHVLTFPRAQGFTSECEEQRGIVFSLAIIAEALGSVRDLDPRIAPIVEGILAQLVTLERSDGSGWAYFPGLAELPSDADDLAAVLRAFACLRGPREAAHLVRQPLTRWLESIPANGRPSTWIASGDESTRALQTHWMSVAWGDTYDVEVAAHMVCALDDIGVTGDGPGLLRSAIAAEQDRGTWHSSWYCGPHYATMMCVRALAPDARYGVHLARTLEWLASAQNTDGAWGYVPGTSDALNTAFALLALARIAQAGANAAYAIGEKALGNLSRLCDRYRVAKTPFIRMELGRAQGIVRQTLLHSSAAVTAAYVLRAARAWESVLQPAPL